MRRVKPDIFEALPRRGSLVGIPGQHPSDELLQFVAVAVKCGRKGKFCSPDVLDGLAVVLRFEGSASTYQFIEQHACSPQVDALSVPSFEHLWGSVVQCASDGPHLEQGSSSSVPPRDAEVYEFDGFVPLIKEYVFGFDIAVYYILFMEVS